MEVYGDNLCSFTKAAFTTIEALAAHYIHNPNVQIRVHWFPLPFHHNAYFVAMADHWVGVHAPDQLWPFANAIFDAQESFFGPAVTTWSPDEVKAHIVSVARNASVRVDGDALLNALNNHTVDLSTRVAWKQAATRGVYETPTLYLNDFRVMQGWPPYQGVAPEPQGRNITTFTSMIDALLQTQPY